MSTFIINLNDTIAMSDSTVVELAKVLGPCQACSQRVENSFNDVYITAIICASVIGAIIIACWAYMCFKKRETKEQTDKITMFTTEIGMMKEDVDKLKEKLDDAQKVKPSKSNEEKTKELLKEIVSMSKDKDGVTNIETAKELKSIYNDVFAEIKKHSDN